MKIIRKIFVREMNVILSIVAKKKESTNYFWFKRCRLRKQLLTSKNSGILEDAEKEFSFNRFA